MLSINKNRAVEGIGNSNNKVNDISIINTNNTRFVKIKST